MDKYLDNLKWIISGQTEIETTNSIKSETELEFDSTYDSESEFENVHSIDESLKINIEKINMKKIKKEYRRVQKELINKEQLVRDRLDSDTIEHIKSNCKEYVNDEIKIIKDFATVIESFNHIKEKIIKFELDMKEFESDIKIKTINQDLSNTELDNRINMIDKKLNNTISMIEQINLTSNELMKKIVKLENIIQTHSTQREELLTKLNKVELTKPECYSFWNKYVYNFFDIDNLSFNEGIGKILFASTCVIGTFVIFKYTWNKK